MDESSFSPESGAVQFNEDDLFRLINEGQWEDVIVALTTDMDPWDINLVKLNERFMEIIKKGSELDLRIPAKIILTAAILYRMKVESLHSPEVEEMDTMEEFNEGDEQINNLEEISAEGINIPPLAMPIKRAPKGKVSMDDLVNALEKAMTIKNRRAAREIFSIELCGEDITEVIENLFTNICKVIEAHPKAKFSYFLSTKERKDKIQTFNSLLHLSNQQRVYCFQPEIFGEIYLYGGGYGDVNSSQ